MPGLLFAAISQPVPQHGSYGPCVSLHQATPCKKANSVVETGHSFSSYPDVLDSFHDISFFKQTFGKPKPVLYGATGRKSGCSRMRTLAVWPPGLPDGCLIVGSLTIESSLMSGCGWSHESAQMAKYARNKNTKKT